MCMSLFFSYLLDTDINDQVAPPWLKSKTQRRRIWELNRIPKLNIFTMQYIFSEDLIVVINKMATEKKCKVLI